MNTAFGEVLKTLLTLDFLGILAALFLGVLLWFFGGFWALFVMLLFLVISSVATKYKKHAKIRIGSYEAARGWKNVAANGAPPLLVLVLRFLLAGPAGGAAPADPYSAWGVFAYYALTAAFVASVSAITADKLSSEIGVLDKRSFMLLTLKKSKPGISGGVSSTGLWVGFAGSLGLSAFGIIYAFWHRIPGFGVSALLVVCLMVAVSGLLGDVADSVLGYFENIGIGNKYSSNIACGLVGALCGFASFAVLVHYLM